MHYYLVFALFWCSEVVRRMAQEGSYNSNTPIGIGGAGLTPSAPSAQLTPHPSSDSNSLLPHPACVSTHDSLPYTNDVCVKQVTNPLLTAGSRLTGATTTSFNSSRSIFNSLPMMKSVDTKYDRSSSQSVMQQTKQKLSVAICDVEQMNNKNKENGPSELKHIFDSTNTKLPSGDFSSLTVMEKIEKIETGKLCDSDDSLSSTEEGSFKTASILVDKDTTSNDFFKDYVDMNISPADSEMSNETHADKRNDFASDICSELTERRSSTSDYGSSLVTCPSRSVSEDSCSSVCYLSSEASDLTLAKNCHLESFQTPASVSTCDDLSDIAALSLSNNNDRSSISDSLRSVILPAGSKKSDLEGRELSVFNSLPVYPIVGPLLSTDLHISDSSLNEKVRKVSPTNRFSEFLNNTKNSVARDSSSSSSKNVHLLSYKSTPTLVHHGTEPQISAFPRSSSGFLTPTIIENFSTDSLPSFHCNQSVIDMNLSEVANADSGPTSSVVNASLFSNKRVSPSPSSTFPSRSRFANSAILHHIIPQRMYPSPRPLRRGTSTESLQPTPSNVVASSPSSTSLVFSPSTILSKCSLPGVSMRCPSAISHLHSGVSGATYTSQPNLCISSHPSSHTERATINDVSEVSRFYWQRRHCSVYAVTSSFTSRDYGFNVQYCIIILTFVCIDG